MSIRIEELRKSFGDHQVLKGVTLEIPDGELVALLGPSGGGKTTLLRSIAGLETPDSGQILFQGRDATRSRPQDRGVGFVFQHYALFRHMSVFENVAFGLRAKPRRERPAEAEIVATVRELLQLVQLDWVADRRPDELSGGQRQRIALARALAPKPNFLLLDEPFGALDTRVRKDLRRWLRKLHDDLGMTSIFVTHDQDEALELADRVVVVMEGQIAQSGTPDEVYDHPASPEVYRFLGDVNLFHGRITSGSFVPQPSSNDGEATATAYVRPHELEIDRFPVAEASIPALVVHAVAVGSKVRVEMRQLYSGQTMEAEISRDRHRNLGLASGDSVWATPKIVRVFREGEEVAI